MSQINTDTEKPYIKYYSVYKVYLCLHNVAAFAMFRLSGRLILSLCHKSPLTLTIKHSILSTLSSSALLCTAHCF